MPKKNRTRKVSLVVRKGPNRRKTRQAAPGERTPGTQVDAVAAPSLFAMKWKPIAGSRVYFRSPTGRMQEMGFLGMYDALFLAYTKLAGLDPKTAAKIDPLRSIGLPYDSAFEAIHNLIKPLIPRDASINIDGSRKSDGPSHYVTIFQECEFPHFWHVFAVGPVLLRLAKDWPRLHDLFVLFLKSFEAVTRLSFWFDSTVQYSLDYLHDNLDDIAEEQDPDVVIRIAMVDDYYRNEAPSYYQRLIKSQTPVSGDELIKMTNRLKKNNPIVTLIRAGCELMNEGFSLYEFIYYPYDPDGGNIFLELEFQATIMWELADDLSAEYEQFIDATANEGVQEPCASIVQEPCASIKIDNDTKEIDFKKFKRAISWPSKLSRFFDLANDCIAKYLENE